MATGGKDHPAPFGRAEQRRPSVYLLGDQGVRRPNPQPARLAYHGPARAGSVVQARIGDNTYRTTQTVRAGGGLMADLHEFYLTVVGTALVTAYQKTTADLSAVGGPKKGAILASHAQEVDLATGKVLLDWDSLDHVGLQESYQAVPADGAPFDYFHINSISDQPNGNLLVSARNTWALYELERTTGQVLWRLNGKKSDFTMAPGANFYWQHHSRAFPDGTFTVFDDGSSPPEERQSRALVLSVDTKAKHVSLKRAYQHPARLIAANHGSVQLLANGHVFVGWGNQPDFSEFAQDGRLLLDGELPINVQSYRAFTHDWIGRPTELPSIAVRSNPAGGNLVYASWNGATEIKSWRVLAGKDTSSLAPVGDEEWTGFETAVAVNSSGPKFVALALDARGKELRRSELTAPSAAGATG